MRQGCPPLPGLVATAPAHHAAEVRCPVILDFTPLQNGHSWVHPAGHLCCGHTSSTNCGSDSAGTAGGKDSKGDGGNNSGNAGSGSQELDRSPDQDGPPPPPLAAMQRRQGWQASVEAKVTKRAMGTLKLKAM
jgi:hypothetical protein